MSQFVIREYPRQSATREPVRDPARIRANPRLVGQFVIREYPPNPRLVSQFVIRDYLRISAK